MTMITNAAILGAQLLLCGAAAGLLVARWVDMALFHRLASAAILCGLMIAVIANALNPGDMAAVIAALSIVGLIVTGWVILKASGARRARHTTRDLETESTARQKALEELTAIKAELEQRVEERARELAASALRLDLAVRNAMITVFNQDRELRYTWMSRGVLGHAPEWFIGKTDYEIFDEPQRDMIVLPKLDVLANGVERDFEAAVPAHDGTLCWFDVHLEPLREADGLIKGVSGVAVDITELKKREDHIHLLMREIAHRSKNALAVVQAMARQTAATTTSTEAFMTAFSARLNALASSHNVLVDEGWTGAEIDGVIRTQLSHYIELPSDRVRISGPSLKLPAETVQNIALAFHELATNAVKYGALSVPQGRIDIEWTISPSQDENLDVVIEWREEHGPPVSPPTRKGFGQLVIEKAVARAVNGKVSLAYEPAGLRWRLSFMQARNPV